MQCLEFMFGRVGPHVYLAVGPSPSTPWVVGVSWGDDPWLGCHGYLLCSLCLLACLLLTRAPTLHYGCRRQVKWDYSLIKVNRETLGQRLPTCPMSTCACLVVGLPYLVALPCFCWIAVSLLANFLACFRLCRLSLPWVVVLSRSKFSFGLS